jgi:hypothetical protein
VEAMRNVDADDGERGQKGVSKVLSRRSSR